jgi:D-alanyl-D-alanine carboxypeptidase
MPTVGRNIQALIHQAGREAQQDGSAAIEAQHLLLALAAGQDAITHQVLTAAGLDRRTIRDALDREFTHSLSAVGVSLAAFGLPRPDSAAKRPTQLGASARLALERGSTSGPRTRDQWPAHLLLGILRAEVGTVPRALALAGIDWAGLAERVRQALAGTGE